MPQDSMQQAIVRGAIVRIQSGEPVPGSDDVTIKLSASERAIVLSVLTDFVRVPAERTPGDPLRA